MIGMIWVSPVYGPVSTTLYVDPSSIIDTTKTVGTTFTINIKVKDVTDLFGFEFFLNYTASVLNVLNTSETFTTKGSFFPHDQVPWHNETNNNLGFIWYAASVPFGSTTGVDGSGILVTIPFNVTSVGESSLDLCKTILINHSGYDIAHKVYDGYFSNILRPTKLHVEPKDTIDPSLVQGENFAINVSILKTIDLYGFNFFLNYTTDVLTATDVILGSFFPSDSVIWHEEINDTLGYVWYNVTMPVGAPSGESGNGTLATIKFTVDSIGETALDLCNTKLVDSHGELIEYDTVDGSFNDKPIIHDVAITNVTTTITKMEVSGNVSLPVTKRVSEVHAGDKVNVTVRVENHGTRSETFNVTAYYDDNQIGTPKNITLTAGSGISTLFEWNTEGVATGNYTISAEASGVVDDINLDDNELSMAGGFIVLGGRLPLELIVGAIVVIIPVVIIAVYFIKKRKPKVGAV